MGLLVQPSFDYEASYRTYIQELGDTERYPFPLDFEYADFAALIRRLSDNAAGIGLADGHVPNSTFWLIEDGEIVGVSNLRHKLTESLMMTGGHIGFGVRPSAQNRGVGQELLTRTLGEARKLGIEAVYLTCHKANLASSGVIVACGGELESEYSVPQYSGILQRYVLQNRG